MNAPPLYGTFHITALFTSLIFAVLCAHRAGSLREEKRLRLLFFTGIVLLALEVFKQAFYFLVVNDRVYDPWFFPFQLCSVPMYLCVLLPLTQGRIRRCILTFFVDYTFYGALFALLFPEGFLRPQLPMTLHGFLWHALLLFLALLTAFSGMADTSFSAFLDATLLLLALCALALGFNVLLEGTGLPSSYPDMFYLTPFHHTTQPVASTAEDAFGRLCARLLYVAGIIGFGFLSHVLYRIFRRLRTGSAVRGDAD